MIIKLFLLISMVVVTLASSVQHSELRGSSPQEMIVGDPMMVRLLALQYGPRSKRSPIYTGYFPSLSVPSSIKAKSRILHTKNPDAELEDQEGVIPNDDETLLTSAQTLRGQRTGARRRQEPGFSGTVREGKSSYVSGYNRGVPVYGAGEPYYFSYTHNFPIGVEDFENLVNSHNLPKKYKFTGSLDVTGLLE